MHFSSGSARSKPKHEVREPSESGKQRSRGKNETRSPSPAQGSSKRRRKEFAWMDSGDEEDGEKAASAAGSSGDEAAQAYSAPAVQKPADIETLSQMLRYMEKCPRSKILRMPLAELAAICQAAARVKYYEASAFGDVCSAIKVHLRSSERPDPSDIAGIVAGLASVNAYDAELFEAAAQILQKHFGTALDRPLRRQIVDAYKKVNHKTELQIIRTLADQEGQARYGDACVEVAAIWQKPGVVSSSAMALGFR